MTIRNFVKILTLKNEYTKKKIKTEYLIFFLISLKTYKEPHT